LECSLKAPKLSEVASLHFVDECQDEWEGRQWLSGENTFQDWREFLGKHERGAILPLDRLVLGGPAKSTVVLGVRGWDRQIRISAVNWVHAD
jgi:hypothetical protein